LWAQAHKQKRDNVIDLVPFFFMLRAVEVDHQVRQPA
jgi:hypothetical protein